MPNSTKVVFLLLFLLLTPMLGGNLTLVKAQSAGSMFNGVLAHEMTSGEAQTLANSGINWVSCDVTFNPSDDANWFQVYSLAKQYNLSVVGILDQHLMNFSNTFSLEDWSTAVNQSVQSFGDVVKTWEIWNEPTMPEGPLGYFDGSPQSYVNMLHVAYTDIKAAAPTDTVIGLGGMPLYDSENQTINFYTQQGLTWANQTVQLGAMNYCDAIAVHAYPYGQYFSIIAGSFFSSDFRQYSLMCNKSIWVTEVGTESQSSTWAATETQQSTFLSQSYSLFQNLGAKAYIWYELNDNYTDRPNSNFGLFDNNGNPKQAFETFANLASGGSSPSPSPSPSPTAQPTQAPSSQTPNSPPPTLTPTNTVTPPETKIPTSIPELSFVFVLPLIIAITLSPLLTRKRARSKH